MHELANICSTKELLALRLVCKSWLAAVDECPRGFTHKMELRTDMVPKFMPKMYSLQLGVISAPNHSNAVNLSVFSNLTRLDARSGFLDSSPGGVGNMSLCLVPACLPHSLRELTLDFMVDLKCVLQFSCTHLTRLAFACDKHTYRGVEALLQHLPELKVNLSCQICYPQRHGNMQSLRAT